MADRGPLAQEVVGTQPLWPPGPPGSGPAAGLPAATGVTDRAGPRLYVADYMWQMGSPHALVLDA
jgi:hypothetical protein